MDRGLEESCSSRNSVRRYVPPPPATEEEEGEEDEDEDEDGWRAR